MKKVDLAQVIIVIPIYKPELTIYEKVALKQMHRVLAKYPKTFIAPESLFFDFGELGTGVTIERFPDYFFRGIVNYSALLLNIDFYRRFQDYEYMLVYQTDAFVFSDRLSDFCRMGYDYIGAPMSRMNPIWDFITDRVGNGGLSLRKISSAINMLEKCQAELNGAMATIFWQWEDVFWGYCGRHKRFKFNVPTARMAVEFALQDNIAHGYKRMQQGWRPFGCHGWWKMNYWQWKPIIEECGYKFPAGENPGKKQYPRLYVYLKSRNTVNLPYLWGLYRKGLYDKMLLELRKWLTDYPAESMVWQLNMEAIICIWRLVEVEQAENKVFRISCQILLVHALQNALRRGVQYELCRNLLVTMLPHLQKYDYTPMQELVQQIKDNWWSFWINGKNTWRPCNYRAKKILVLSKFMDEDWLVESFVRHTLTFASVLLIDIRCASKKVEQILALLEKEGMKIILHKQELRWQDFSDGMDLVLEISPNDFLLPQIEDYSVHEALCKLEKGCHYVVEMDRYVPYLPFAYNNKFILSRPLMRYIEKKGAVHLLSGNDEKVYRSKELYIARIADRDDWRLVNAMMPADMELTDISYFAPNHELKYTTDK